MAKYSFRQHRGGLAALMVGLGVSGCAGADPSGPARVSGEPITGPEDRRGDEEAAPDDGSPPWEPLAPEADYEGQSLEQWAIAWLQWVAGQDSCRNALFDADGSLCGDRQDDSSPVFFFHAGVPGTVRTRCAVPAGKAIMIPLANITTDNAIPSDEQRSDAELEAAADDAKASIRDLSLWVGKSEVTDLDAWTVGTIRTAYDVPPEPNLYSCSGVEGVSGHIEPAFLAGVFVLFPPPTTGEHTMAYGGTITSGRDVVNDVLTTFVVE